MGVVPDGGEKLAALTRACRNAGETGLLRELQAGTRKPLQALIPRIIASAREHLPKRGGFAEEFVRKLRLTVRQRNTGRYPGIRLIASYAGRVKRIDQGRLRHPVFADADEARTEWTWPETGKTQRITPGWFSDPVNEAHPEILRAAEEALQRVARQIEIDIERGR